MRVAITGATGFVGSHLTRRLVDRHEVAVSLRRESDPWRIRDLLPRVTVVCNALELARFRPKALIHLAWAGVGSAARNDITQLENIERAAQTAEIAYAAGVEHWIGMGSQAEYGPCGGRITEDTPTRPTTLYGVAKLAAGLACGNICRQRRMRFAWLRLFSSYGPMDNPAWMLPYLIGKLLKRERPSLTAGEQRWDYLYITEVAEAIRVVMEDERASGVYNLGSGEAPPLRQIIEMARDTIDPALPLGFGEEPYRPDQVMHLEADISRLKELGWRPDVTLEEGIRRTVEWYRGSEKTGSF